LEAGACLAREPVLPPHTAAVVEEAVTACTAAAAVGLERTASPEEPIARTASEPACTALASEEAVLECTKLVIDEEDPIVAQNSSSSRGTAAALVAVEEAPWLDTVGIHTGGLRRRHHPRIATTSTRLVVVVPPFARWLGAPTKASVWCPARMRAPEPHSQRVWLMLNRGLWHIV
jgi:hypothetical protein